jgi:hypothetical protein
VLAVKESNRGLIFGPDFGVSQLEVRGQVLM